MVLVVLKSFLKTVVRTIYSLHVNHSDERKATVSLAHYSISTKHKSSVFGGVLFKYSLGFQDIKSNVSSTFLEGSCQREKRHLRNVLDRIEFPYQSADSCFYQNRQIWLIMSI